MHRFMLNAVYLIALAILSPWIVWRGIRKGSFLLSWQERWFGRVPQMGQSPIIWLHAVSVGEVNLLGSLVRELKKRYPDKKIAISSTTATGLRLAKSMFPQDIVVRFPLDLSWAIKRVFSRWNVSQIVLSELELWPNLIDEASRRSIPVCIVNGRLSESSFKGYQRVGFLFHPMFRSMSFVGAQNDECGLRFRLLGVANQNVQVTGNIKFDNCELDPFTHNSQSMRNMLNLVAGPGSASFRQADKLTGHEAPIWVVGSTQEGEEAIALETYTKLRLAYPALRLIVVPRHPERADSVSQLIKDSGFNYARLSEVKSTKSIEAWNVLLVDTVGDLKWIWSLADIAFVGGSFGDRGGQNMIEPAAFGASVAVGPNTRNFAEVVSILKDAQCLTQLERSEQLYDWALCYLADSELRNSQATRARDIISAQRGALLRTLDGLAQTTAASSVNSARAA